MVVSICQNGRVNRTVKMELNAPGTYYALAIDCRFRSSARSGGCGTDLVISVLAGLPTGLTTFARQHSLYGPTAIAFVDGLLNPVGKHNSLDVREARRPAAPYASDRNTRPSIFRLKSHGNPPHAQTVIWSRGFAL